MRKIALLAAGVAAAVGMGLATAGSAHAATYYNTLGECQAALNQGDYPPGVECQESWGGARKGWFINDASAQG
jgi:uncharacterized protein YgiB involved in biofilm formation